MRCTEFLRLYSDFRDGLIEDARLKGQLGQHLARCPSCKRYDASVRGGVQALRYSSYEMEPTPGFKERLRARIAAGAEPEVPATPSPAGVAALLMLAAALALVIHERSSRQAAGQAPLVANRRATAPHNGPMIVVNPGVPFVTFTDLEVPAFSGPSEHNPHQVPIDTWANLPR